MQLEHVLGWLGIFVLIVWGITSFGVSKKKQKKNGGRNMKETDEQINAKIEQCGNCHYNWNFIGEINLEKQKPNRGWCYMFKVFEPECKRKLKINDYRCNEIQTFTTPKFEEAQSADARNMVELKKEFYDIMGLHKVIDGIDVVDDSKPIDLKLRAVWQWIEKKLEAKIKFWVDAWNIKEKQLQEAKAENEKLKSEVYAKPEIDDLIKRDPVFFFLVNAIRTLTNEQRVVLIEMLLERTDNNLFTQARQEGFDEGLYKCNEAVLTAQAEARIDESERIISHLIPSNFDIPAFTHTADFVHHLQYIQKRLSELINADQVPEQPAKSCETCKHDQTESDICAKSYMKNWFAKDECEEWENK